MIAALFVATGGCYFGLEGVDPWDVHRDARKYDGPYPVVAHPPCQLWVNLAAVNWKRYQRERPAWYPGGSDGSCFASALASVRRWGGVLEHPASTHAFAAHDIPSPTAMGWQSLGDDCYICEVWQSAYGHRARKRTWLFYVGTAPADLRLHARPGEAQIGFFERKRASGIYKPGLGKREASATPPAFRDALIGLARASRVQECAA